MDVLLLAALVCSVPLAASMLAGLLARGRRRWAIPLGAWVLLVVTLVVLFVTDSGEMDVAPAVGAVVAYALVAAALLWAAYGGGTAMRKAPWLARILIGFIVIVGGGFGHFYATVFIVIFAACSGQDACLS